MPILGDNTISKSTQLHRTFEGRSDWASQTELNNREAALDAMREQEAEKAERARKVCIATALALDVELESVKPESDLCKDLGMSFDNVFKLWRVILALWPMNDTTEYSNVFSRTVTVQDVINIIEDYLAGQP